MECVIKCLHDSLFFFSMIKTYLVHASKGINKNAWEFSLHILVVSKVLVRQPFKIWKYPQNFYSFMGRPYLSNVLIQNGFRIRLLV